MNVAPCTGAWIETLIGKLKCLVSESHPARVRGLKPARADGDGDGIQSHPARVRGLKQNMAKINGIPVYVAPCTGAWIETM